MTNRRHWLLLTAIGLAAAASGCIVSPQPSPPGEEPALDGGLIGTDGGPESLTDSVRFVGAPGTVDPAEGSVIITNLDDAELPTSVAVDPDGGFDVLVPGDGGDTFRFQALADGQRSDVTDLTVSADKTSITPAGVGRVCLVMTTTSWFSLGEDGSAQSILVRNDCPEAVAHQAPRLRRGQAGFTFAPTTSGTIQPGETLIVTARRTAAGTEAEDVLIVDFLDAEQSRRAITLVRD